MKSFIVLAVVVSVACAAPQFIADTYEVQEAKRQFAAAYNAAARAAAVASPAQVVASADYDESPAALPYVHDEPPYEHVEIPALPYVHQEGPQAPTAPVQAQVQLPVAQTGPVLAYANIPAGQLPWTGGCYNYRGEGVPCRE